MIITKIGCKIDQSCKIKCDVLICGSVGETSRSRNIPNNKVRRRLLGTAAKLGIIGSCVTEIKAQLAANMLLSRPLASPCVMPVLLPIVWPPIGNRLAYVLVIVAVVIGTLVAMRTTPIMAKF